ncbi:MAG: hypothetical protein JOZ15_22215 [Acidobacteria bacterium]|nr:hypothetical protein [Acidobacteriota bacterium]
MATVTLGAGPPVGQVAPTWSLTISCGARFRPSLVVPCITAAKLGCVPVK